MDNKKTPHLKQGGTDRAAREVAVAKNLSWLRARDPGRFAEAMRILAALTVGSRSKKK